MDFQGTGLRLTARDYANAAADLGVQPYILQGVVAVEAAGSGFDKNRRPKILTEPHVFYSRLGKGPKRDRAVKLGIAYPKWGQKPYPKTSDGNYDRLRAMMAIDEKAALESTSWGLSQIMGFNAKDAGFKDVYAMVEAMKTGEAAQLLAFANLIESFGLADELQRKDAAGFARRYNGPGYAKNGYDLKLKREWASRESGRGTIMSLMDAVPTDVRGPTEEEVEENLSANAQAYNPVLDEADVDHARQIVLSVQTALKGLGYYEVGMVDGGDGGLTRTQVAIMAFRVDNQMPVTTPEGQPLGIDNDLLIALHTAKPRQIGDARALATAKDLKDRPAVASTLRQKALAAFGVVSAGAATAVQGISSMVDNAQGYLEPVKQFFSDVPGWVWGAAVMGLAIMLWQGTRRTENQIVDEFRQGERL